MIMDIEEFFHDFRQDLLSGAEAREDFLEAEFALSATKELEESGAIEGFEPCHYKAPRGMRVDGYWLNDDGISIDLFIVDFANREVLESLTRSDVDALFKRIENFFTACALKGLYSELEETSPGYGLARDISNRAETFAKVNFYLLSERLLSQTLQAIDDKSYQGWTFSYNIWDISRLHRIRTSRGAKEEVVIDFETMFGQGIPCLPAHLRSADYESYLMVMPATILGELYGKYGDRLLEQNVRCFLQARGKVNKGIRSTILTDPEMFFAYNNGITATAREVITESKADGIYIREIKDLQVVNGGQTTASLFHTSRKDKASLEKIFVQMKLSVVDSEKGEEVIPRISEYANTQNKVNAADFFSNHPFHIRMEEFSRRLWAPPQQGALRESKWFYERARGQYSDAQAKVSKAEKKKFLAEFPSSQMLSKTDLAKFENVWDEKPTYVNLGAQKNFAQYAKRIGQEWAKNPDNFNELYYKRAIARAILFRKTEKIVSAQPWYSGGYRANIVAYTLALLSKLCADMGKSFDFMKVWETQDITGVMKGAIEITAKVVSDSIMTPMAGISNISEWCKKEACWDGLQLKSSELKTLLPKQFLNSLVSKEDVVEELKSAAKVQKIDNGIEAQKKILSIPAAKWRQIMDAGNEKDIFSPMEMGILQVAAKIPVKIPSEKQSLILIDVLAKADIEGIG
ncbi:MAG: AIPR family protein [Burkholderiales bacterium]|nr:AIPR family protein [Burkholderiales bacterium]